MRCVVSLGAVCGVAGSSDSEPFGAEGCIGSAARGLDSVGGPGAGGAALTKSETVRVTALASGCDDGECDCVTALVTSGADSIGGEPFGATDCAGSCGARVGDWPLVVSAFASSGTVRVTAMDSAWMAAGASCAGGSLPTSMGSVVSGVLSRRSSIGGAAARGATAAGLVAAGGACSWSCASSRPRCVTSTKRRLPQEHVTTTLLLGFRAWPSGRSTACARFLRRKSFARQPGFLQ